MDYPSPRDPSNPDNDPAADAPAASHLPDSAPDEEMPVLELVPEPPVQNLPPPGYAPSYLPGTGYPAAMPGAPPGYPPGLQPMWDARRGWYYPTPEELARAESARRQVRLSHWFGWGGLAVMFLGPLVALMLTRGNLPQLYSYLAGLGLFMAIAGAVIGQIGRAKQNRVI